MSGGNPIHSRYVRGGRHGIAIKMPPDMKAALQLRAKLDGISANEWVLRLIERELLEQRRAA